MPAGFCGRFSVWQGRFYGAEASRFSRACGKLSVPARRNQQQRPLRGLDLVTARSPGRCRTRKNPRYYRSSGPTKIPYRATVGLFFRPDPPHNSDFPTGGRPEVSETKIGSYVGFRGTLVCQGPGKCDLAGKAQGFRGCLMGIMVTDRMSPRWMRNQYVIHAESQDSPYY